mmetsp:Transcript_17412/g.41291  ORF Transcript_17412/g.41291 Transcript_17412/m.41291 type:complete len:228 (+) Transcript_17412:492-1175(+)
MLLAVELKTAEVVSTFEQRDRRVLAHVAPISLGTDLAAPLAVFGREFHGLPEAFIRAIHQQQALGRPGGSAVVCEHLPVDEARFGFVLLGRNELRLASGVVEEREGSVLVEVELVPIQREDVRVAVLASVDAALFDLYNRAGAGHQDFQLLHATDSQVHGGAFAVEAALLIYVLFRDQFIILIEELDLGVRIAIILVPQKDVLEVLHRVPLEDELGPRSLGTVIHSL